LIFSTFTKPLSPVQQKRALLVGVMGVLACVESLDSVGLEKIPMVHQKIPSVGKPKKGD